MEKAVATNNKTMLMTNKRYMAGCMPRYVNHIKSGVSKSKFIAFVKFLVRYYGFVARYSPGFTSHFYIGQYYFVCFV